VDLSGAWRAAVADDDLRRVAFGLDYDDDGWEPIEVPGHWRSTAAFLHNDDPLIYRTRFELDPGPPGARHWVILDGLFYQGDVWLDGAYLGDPEGYFFPHAYDVTELARLAPDHVLAVEVTCAPQGDRTKKRNLTGVFQDSDYLDPDWNPGGLWRPVRVERTGPVRIARLRVLCTEADATRAQVLVRAELESDAPRTVRVRTTMEDRIEREREFTLARGANRVEWSFGVDNPPLWWPWSLGDQPLATVTVAVAVEHERSDARAVRTGLRQVALRNWVMSVNGERLFLKGANVGPTRMALAEATPEELRADAVLARETGLDLVRVHGHVTRPEFYDAADELGLLVWQDLPLQGGYSRGVRRQAVRQAAEAVDVLGHHPSVALWCGHNEPFAVDIGRDHVLDRAQKVRLAVAQELPTWNRTILDRSVRRSLEGADSTRPVIAHSGVVPHLPQLDGTDAHLSFGWHHGDEADLGGFAAAVPRMMRFVGDYGAQGVPADAAFMEPDRWPDLDWDRLGRRRGLQRWVFDERVPPGAFASFDEWRAATQAYQAGVVRHHVEELRRLKYRPTGGFCVFLLADAHPAVSASVVGHDRASKAAHGALVETCRPVIVVADRLPAAPAPGDAVALDVHVVSDLRRPLDGAVVTARLSWPAGRHEWRWKGDVPADTCVRIGTVSFVVPHDGELTLDLDLVASDVMASNRYVGTVGCAERTMR
jgi:beta-mannosidase